MSGTAFRLMPAVNIMRVLFGFWLVGNIVCVHPRLRVRACVPVPAPESHVDGRRARPGTSDRKRNNGPDQAF